MTQTRKNAATETQFPKVQNGLSIPEILRIYPNILQLYLKRPDKPPVYISPTLCYFFSGDGITGRVRDRGRGRGIWKHGQDLHDILAKIDAELGLEWPDWRFDDKREAERYSERKDRLS